MGLSQISHEPQRVIDILDACSFTKRVLLHVKVTMIIIVIVTVAVSNGLSLDPEI